MTQERTDKRTKHKLQVVRNVNLLFHLRAFGGNDGIRQLSDRDITWLATRLAEKRTPWMLRVLGQPLPDRTGGHSHRQEQAVLSDDQHGGDKEGFGGVRRRHKVAQA